jgi:hypothetical protein
MRYIALKLATVSIRQGQGEKDFGQPVSAVSNWLRIASEVVVFGSLPGTVNNESFTGRGLHEVISKRNLTGL